MTVHAITAGERLRVGIYARYSSDLQDARSIDDQVAWCRRYAEQKGYHVVGVYSDAEITGATDERPGFQRLIADAEARSIDGILTEDANRLWRNRQDGARYRARLAYAEAKLITVADGEQKDDLAAAIKDAMAEEYRKTLAGHVRRTMTVRAGQGQVLGSRAYGYEPVAGKFQIVAEQAEVVRRIFRETLAGASPRTIALGLNRDGIPAPRSAKWTAHALNGQNGTGILRNPIYKGTVVWGQRRNARNPLTKKLVARATPATEHVTVAKPELALVSEADWNAVQA